MKYIVCRWNIHTYWKLFHFPAGERWIWWEGSGKDLDPKYRSLRTYLVLLIFSGIYIMYVRWIIQWVCFSLLFLRSQNRRSNSYRVSKETCEHVNIFVSLLLPKSQVKCWEMFTYPVFISFRWKTLKRL